MRLRYLLAGMALLLGLSACGPGPAEETALPEKSAATPAAVESPVSQNTASTTPDVTDQAEAPAVGETDVPASSTGEAPAVVRFQASSPVSTFTAEDIALLGLELSGTPVEIADAIVDWQTARMSYDPGRPDSSDPIRWNYILPGIYPSRDIIRERLDNGGRIYGICFDFAVVYASIARYYGLEVRVMNSISKPSELAGDGRLTTGMGPEEYQRLKVKLAAHGVDYPYEAVRLVAEETPTHYWVEVRLDGQWVVKDASQVATGNRTVRDFYTTNDYEVTDWLARDKSARLVEYTEKLARGERLSDEPPPAGTAGPAGAEPYAGITDDLGQEGRAASIDDLLAGLALAPYFNDARDACDFIRAGADCKDTADEDNAFKQRYEAISGRRLYLVVDFMLEDKAGEELARLYQQYTGEELDLAAYAAAEAE